MKPMEALIQKYKEIINKNGKEPSWAVHKKYETENLVSCTIPFVGKNYCNQSKKIFVYASAEVLNDYYPGSVGEKPWLDDDDIAINRHRWFFDQPEIQDGRYFPDVHLQPMKDGSLTTAVVYIMTKLMHVSQDMSINEFFEKISFGNYGKYTIETPFQHDIRTNAEKVSRDNKNIDYASDRKKLFASHEYVRTDLQVLKPDFIIIPRNIYLNDKTFIDSIKGNAVVIPIYQINSTTINCIIKNFGKEECEEYWHPLIKKCYSNLHENRINGTTKENYKYVFGYLKELLENI